MPATEPLITPEELSERLDQVVAVDIRWALTDPNHGRSVYLTGHIPGAVFADLDTDLSGPPGPGRHPLPEIAGFAATLGRLGITPGSEVVVYDDVGGTVAARLWWMLRSIGHPTSRVLDGGYRAWLDRGHLVEVGDRLPTPVVYPTPVGFSGTVERDRLGDGVLIDARAPERYRGEVEPVDPKAGHIPGAINRPTSSNLGPDGRFRTPAELVSLYGGLGERVFVSCGSGVNACHDALAMVVAGLPMPQVYVGSFSEWSNLDLPVETEGD
ncbi:MAG: sulfurtransferase [Actinobacteria bacterium]|nr:sulfurtransferase [Actinomycetota bacterium]